MPASSYTVTKPVTEYEERKKYTEREKAKSQEGKGRWNNLS